MDTTIESIEITTKYAKPDPINTSVTIAFVFPLFTLTPAPAKPKECKIRMGAAKAIMGEVAIPNRNVIMAARKNIIEYSPQSLLAG